MAKETKKAKLTPEIMKKLQGISVVTDTIPFTIEVDDVPEEFHPTFTIKGLSVKDTHVIKEKLQATTNDDEINDIMTELTRTHVVGWKNLYDLSTGDEFECVLEDGVCAKECFDVLPNNIKVKILGFIYKLQGSLS